MGRMIVALMLLLGWAGMACAQAINWKERVARLETAQGAALEDLKKELVDGGMAAHAALEEGGAATESVRADLRKQIRSKRDVATRAKGLVMHEWGALSYSQGLDDAKIDAAGQDASDLPEFAQVWSKLAASAVQQELMPGEPQIHIMVRKPIVYFYTDKPQTLTFSVACPHGMFTQWSPRVWRVNPDPTAGALPSGEALTGITGLLVWKNFELAPGADGPLPKIPDSAWWWSICRDTDSTLIKVDGVLEKFLFYRGELSDIPPVVQVDGGANKKYTFTNSSKKEAVEHLLLVHVAGGKAMAKYIPSLGAGQTLAVDLAMEKDARPVAEIAPQMRQALAEHLEEAGLFPREAAGMARIWQKEWFEADGVRVIYLNPPGATSLLMPVQVDPPPAQTVRTIMIAVECLKDSRENLVRQMIIDLGDRAYAVRETAQKQLLHIGRQAEPALREALRKTEDEEVRTRIIVILQKWDPGVRIEIQPIPPRSSPNRL
jgi:hypothetical protein